MIRYVCVPLLPEEDDFCSSLDGIYLGELYLHVSPMSHVVLHTSPFTPACLSAGFRRSLRLCRRRSHRTTQPSCLARCPSSCPYEEVVRYRRHPQDAQRLIALLGAVVGRCNESHSSTGHFSDVEFMTRTCCRASGPSGVGVNELRRRLIDMNPNVFQGAVPRTFTSFSSTRPQLKPRDAL